MDTVTIGVATYGDESWRELALERAVPSAIEQAPMLIVHRGDPLATLAKARNDVLDQVETEFVIFLDGDDRLAPGYVHAMLQGSADLRSPSLQQRWPGRAPHNIGVPRVWAHEHACTAECLRAGNWLVVGTMARVSMLRKAGGWQEEGWSEDWSLWARTWVRCGATVEAIPEAVYVAYRRHESRNRTSRAAAAYWHQQIEDSIWPQS